MKPRCTIASGPLGPHHVLELSGAKPDRIEGHLRGSLRPGDPIDADYSKRAGQAPREQPTLPARDSQDEDPLSLAWL